MKRILIFILTAAVLLCGCQKAPTSTAELPKYYSTTADITVGDTTYGVFLSRFADSKWQVELMSPAAVKGLIFNVNGADTEVSFDGLRFTFDTERFPVGSVITTAIGSLDRLAAQTLEVINDDEESLATGSIGEESFTLTLSKTGIPQKLELLNCGMSIVFNTFDVVELETN